MEFDNFEKGMLAAGALIIALMFWTVWNENSRVTAFEARCLRAGGVSMRTPMRDLVCFRADAMIVIE